MSNNPWAPYGLTGAITDYAPRGNSDYNGLSLQATRRYSHNLSFIAAYTWSHTMDDSTATVNTTAPHAAAPAGLQQHCCRMGQFDA